MLAFSFNNLLLSFFRREVSKLIGKKKKLFAKISVSNSFSYKKLRIQKKKYATGRYLYTVNSLLADTPIKQAVAKSPGKNKLQTFD